MLGEVGVDLVEQLGEALPQIVFRRDGAVEFNVGSDVSSIFFKKDPPTSADLIIYVANNTQAAYIDIQLTGQNRIKMVALEAAPQPPLDPTASASDWERKGKRKKSRLRVDERAMRGLSDERNDMTRARRRDGFTILEIMIATAILTLGLAGILALFPVAIHTGKQIVDPR